MKCGRSDQLYFSGGQDLMGGPNAGRMFTHICKCGSDQIFWLVDKQISPTEKPDWFSNPSRDILAKYTLNDIATSLRPKKHPCSHCCKVCKTLTCEDGYVCSIFCLAQTYCVIEVTDIITHKIFCGQCDAPEVQGKRSTWFVYDPISPTGLYGTKPSIYAGPGLNIERRYKIDDIRDQMWEIKFCCDYDETGELYNSPFTGIGYRDINIEAIFLPGEEKCHVGKYMIDGELIKAVRRDYCAKHAKLLTNGERFVIIDKMILSELPYSPK